MQALAHEPAAQDWEAAHLVPHAPQFAGSVFVSTHFPLHRVSVPAHPHWPFAQTWPVGHACPHDPQFFASTWVFVQICELPAPQMVLPQAQEPELQVNPAPQAFPHDPQFLGSFDGFTHAGFAGCGQEVADALHWQAEATHEPRPQA